MKIRLFASTIISLLLAASALPVFADTAAGGTTGGATSAQPAVQKTVDLACMQTAVEKRDNAIISALDAYSSAVKTALQTRRDALKDAWGITDRKQRRSALRTAWNAFKGTWRNAAKSLRIAKRDAWMQFNKDQRTCKGNAGDEPAGGQGVDAQL
ncbi:hypothetical protein KGQ34_02455 [Patescibacteria group bacterium]|nr:hypothetical protein [Patescibacteria group bacterium]